MIDAVADRELFFSKVTKTKTCWLWLRATTYGGFRGKSAHRVAYEIVKGPIPDGMVIDHLCMIKNCVNPDHLEAVTQSENMRRFWAAKHKGLI